MTEIMPVESIVSIEAVSCDLPAGGVDEMLNDL